MLSEPIFEHLRRAIAANNTEQIRNIIKDNLNLLDKSNYVFEVKLEAQLLVEEVRDRDQDIRDLVENFNSSIGKGAEVYFSKNLVSAICAGNLHATEELLENYVNINEWARSERSSLPAYIFGRSNIDTRVEMLKLLIKHGLDTSIKNRWNKNLLHEFASDYANRDDTDAVEIAEILVNSGISVDDEDFFGFTSIHSCHKKAPNYDLVLFLMNHGNVNLITPTLGSSMLTLVQENEDFLRFLVSNGADVNVATESGITAMHIEAKRYQRKSVMRFLIDNGSRVSVEDSKGRTPFLFVFPRVLANRSCRILMIKEFALQNFLGFPILQTDTKLIQADRKYQKMFDACTKELHESKNIKFYQSYTYCSVLCKRNIIDEDLKNLMSNPTVALNFVKGLNSFKYYKGELRRIFNKSIRFERRIATEESSCESSCDSSIESP